MNKIIYAYNLHFKNISAKYLFCKIFKKRDNIENLKDFLMNSDNIALYLKNLNDFEKFDKFLRIIADNKRYEIEISSNREIYKDLEFELYSLFRKNLDYEANKKLFNFIYSISQMNNEDDLIKMIKKISLSYHIMRNIEEFI